MGQIWMEITREGGSVLGGNQHGVRVIYYWLKEDGQIFMLLVYPKSEKDNLTDRETAILRELVKELCHG